MQIKCFESVYFNSFTNLSELQPLLNRFHKFITISRNCCKVNANLRAVFIQIWLSFAYHADEKTACELIEKIFVLGN